MNEQEDKLSEENIDENSLDYKNVPPNNTFNIIVNYTYDGKGLPTNFDILADI